MGSKYHDEFLGALHETAEGLHQIGVISDAEMREYDRNCLARKDKAAPVAGHSRSKPVTPAVAGQRKR